MVAFGSKVYIGLPKTFVNFDNLPAAAFDKPTQLTNLNEMIEKQVYCFFIVYFGLSFLLHVIKN